MSAKRLRCAVIEVTRGDSLDDDDFVVRELPTDGDPYVAMLVRRLVSEIRAESQFDVDDDDNPCDMLSQTCLCRS